MTSRERVRAVLAHKKPDRLPFNFWMDRDLMAALDKRFGENFRVNHYGADVIETFPAIHFETDNPDPDDPRCYASIQADRAKYPDKALFALQVTPLEILFGRVGLERLFCDMIDKPERMDETLDCISRVLLRAVDHIAACDVDALYLAGDICCTRGEMMSQAMLRRFCFGPIKKLVDRAHALDLPVLYHTDGRVANILPLFVEYGFDGINPLQASVNDTAAFARDYADKLIIYGGIDNCFIIPNGTTQQVRAHIRQLFDTLGRSGLIASSHDIPAHVPMENLEAMVDEIKKCVGCSSL